MGSEYEIKGKRVDKLNPIFNELDRRLSHVQRWPILVTIQRQTVAEHLHNVAKIADRIARDWFNVTDPETLYAVVRWALDHDAPESLSGDLPSMVKPYFDEESMVREHREYMRFTDPMDVPFLIDSSLVKSIVKLADKMEGYYFLAMERTLGNRFCDAHIEEEKPIILKYVRDTFDERILGLVENWLHVSSSPKSIRISRRGR